MSSPAAGRLQRVLGGWTANLVQFALGITQQVILVPLFLRFQTSDVLAAWLAVYATGNLALIADFGLQVRVTNRFLAFKSCSDPDRRTARYFAAMQRIYLGLVALLIGSVLIGGLLLRPSSVFGFGAQPEFDVSFMLMIVSMLLVLPSNLAAGLYRARGRYARAVWVVCIGTAVGQLGQIVVLATMPSLSAVTIAYAMPSVAAAWYMAFYDVRRLFPFLQPGSSSQKLSWSWIGGQLRRAFPFAVGASTELALQNLPVLLVSALVVDRVAVAQWGLTRVVAGLVRGLCWQAALPLAAELGHDHALGARLQLRRL